MAIGARGAAIGIARLMGARSIVPPGATGRLGTDLAGKATAALAAIDAGAARVVVHVGAPDEAAHEHDADAKVAAIEAVDAQLLAPLAMRCGHGARGWERRQRRCRCARTTDATRPPAATTARRCRACAGRSPVRRADG